MAKRSAAARRRAAPGLAGGALLALLACGPLIVSHLHAAFVQGRPRSALTQGRPDAAPVLRATAAEAATETAAGADAPAKSRCPFSKENMAMEGAPQATEMGLLPGERYIAMNRFQVREGSDAQFETRWATRKSSLIELDGFRWFGLFRRVPPSGEDPEPYPDDYNYVSFTIWETKKNFNSWRTGPAFKEAHGGGSFFDFFGMIINGFMTSKGPPKPAFWRGMLMEKTQEEKPRLMSGPGGRDDADGSKVLDPEVFVSMNRFTVAPGREAEFEQRWAKRESKLQDMPGFRFFQLMRRDQTPDDEVNYISMAAWDNREAFDNWRNGDGFKKAHGGGGKPPQAGSGHGGSSRGGGGPMGGVLVRPPRPYFYEGKLVLESEQGA